MKICCKCKQELHTNMFHKNVSTKDGFAKYCKKCHYTLYGNTDKTKERQKRYSKSELGKETIRRNSKTEKSRTKHKIYQKNYAQKSDIWKKYVKEYRAKNKGKYLEWREKNKDRLNKNIAIRKKNYVQFKLSVNLRTRLNNIIKRNIKVGSAVKDLGCTVEELKIHLEKQFRIGMNWKNWSRVGWHIDHIIPLSSFDLTNREQFLKACHYTNLQPLWAKDNLIKHNKIL